MFYIFTLLMLLSAPELLCTGSYDFDSSDELALSEFSLSSNEEDDEQNSNKDNSVVVSSPQEGPFSRVVRLGRNDGRRLLIIREGSNSQNFSNQGPGNTTPELLTALSEPMHLTPNGPRLTPFQGDGIPPAGVRGIDFERMFNLAQD